MTNDIGRFSTAPSMSDTEEPADKPAEEQKPPELVYDSTEEFLHEQLLPTYVRDVDGRSAKWCIEWYFHPEALSRIEALWRAWEHLFSLLPDVRLALCPTGRSHSWPSTGARSPPSWC
jgi:hypothetical protein